MKLTHKYSLHRFPKARERVHRIAEDIVKYYDGDVRNIWKGASQSEIHERLMKLNVGQQIGRMIMGSLNDCGLVEGTFDVKADIHVCRVLGRLLFGKELTPDEATVHSRRLYPDNPWKLDRSLYLLGKSSCSKEPDCEECDYKELCKYTRQESVIPAL